DRVGSIDVAHRLPEALAGARLGTISFAISRAALAAALGGTAVFLHVSADLVLGRKKIAGARKRPPRVPDFWMSCWLCRGPQNCARRNMGHSGRQAPTSLASDQRPMRE